ncbi:MAG: hypothetical protein OXD30_01035 [Bryobacterales bacterium]|nr:hypothetical protein [Bryobacterales bacterium]
MVKKCCLLVALLLPPSAVGSPWRVCVTDTSELLTAPVRGAAMREFHALLGAQGAALSFKKCPAGGSRVDLLITDEPPRGLEGVLGLARRAGQTIEPPLQVFYDGALVRHLGRPGKAEALGRALARVAAHETAHLLQQQAAHCAHGLLQSTLPAYELLAADPAPFFLDAHCAHRASD